MDQTAAPEAMLSLVYASNAVIGFDVIALETLLEHARSANVQSGVTGLLLFKDHRFLQLLEGPESAVREKMQVILDDPRHHDVAVLLEKQIATRQFPDWSMGYITADSLRDTPLPGYRTTFDDIDFLADADPSNPIMPALRELIRWFRTNPPTPTAGPQTAPPHTAAHTQQ